MGRQRDQGSRGWTMVSMRRCASAAVAGVLGMALGVPAAPAGAVVGTASITVGESLSWGGPTGVNCPRSVTGAKPAPLPTKADGVWRTITMSRSGSLATSALSGTAVGRARVVSDAHGVTRIDLRMSSTVSLKPSGPSPCVIGYRTRSGATALDVTVAKRSWLAVRSSVTARGAVEGSIGAGKMDESASYFVAPGKSLTRLVAPGSYGMGGEAGSGTSVPAGSTTATSASSSVSGLVAFFPVGTRRSLSGDGRAFATVGHRSCTYNRVRVTFTDRTRTSARQIALYVNGDRRYVLRGRSLQRSSILLTRIAASSDGVVKAVVTTKSGARRTMRSTSWPCR